MGAQEEAEAAAKKAQEEAEAAKKAEDDAAAAKKAKDEASNRSKKDAELVASKKAALAKAAKEMDAEETKNKSSGKSQESSFGAKVIGRQGSIPILEDGSDGFPNLREAALPDDEFEKLFGMTKEKFYTLRKWRQDSKKKDVGLW